MIRKRATLAILALFTVIAASVLAGCAPKHDGGSFFFANQAENCFEAIADRSEAGTLEIDLDVSSQALSLESELGEGTVRVAVMDDADKLLFEAPFTKRTTADVDVPSGKCTVYLTASDATGTVTGTEVWVTKS